MLNTIEFGFIRIISKRPDHRFNTFIDFDLIGDWEFWSLYTGEIVAYFIGEEEG